MTPSELLHRPAPGSFVATIRADQRARWLTGAAAFAALGLASSQNDDGLVLCPFRRCTGGYCPGCGMTRATGALLRGDIVASWQQHPFLLLAVVQFTAIGAWSVAAGDRAASFRRQWQTQLLVANAAALGVIWAIRLVTGSIPVPFS